MVAIIGIVVLMVCVFGLPVMHGEMGPILDAAPHELFTIFGAGHSSRKQTLVLITEQVLLHLAHGVAG